MPAIVETWNMFDKLAKARACNPWLQNDSDEESCGGPVQCQ